MIITVIAFIVVLGVLIFIHELGHFIVAKWAGVGVETFSLGFGPRILWYNYGETEYRVSILPLGGYVKMVGESPEEGADEEMTDEEREKSFTLKPLSKRIPIVAAGSVMNIILALVLFPVIYMLGVEVPAYLDRPTEVGYVVPGGAGEKAGIRKGDVIASVEGREVATWEDFVISVALDPERDLAVVIRRGEETFEADFLHDEAIGVFPKVSVKIDTVLTGGAAEEAGLKPGDVLLSMDGAPLDHLVELQNGLKERPGEREMVVMRDGKEITLTITPKYNEDLKTYRIGVSLGEDMVTKKYGFVGAVKVGTKRAVDLTVLLFEVIRGLIVGDYSTKTLGGPILIAQVAGQAAKTGLTEVLTLVAFLSLQLGIINLFPIPVLDGGHLVFYMVEFVRGKPLPDRVIGYAQQVGVFMLVALMVLVTWNDILRSMGKL